MKAIDMPCFVRRSFMTLRRTAMASGFPVRSQPIPNSFLGFLENYSSVVSPVSFISSSLDKFI